MIYRPRPGSRVSIALRDLLEVCELARAAGVDDELELKRWLRDAWHWGERTGWPYKAWLKARQIALERWRGRDLYPMSLPYVEDPELAAWLLRQGFREVRPDPGPDRRAPNSGEQTRVEEGHFQRLPCGCPIDSGCLGWHAI